MGESPFWHPDEQALYWLDIAGRRVRRARNIHGAVEPVSGDDWAMPSEPGCMAPCLSGGLVLGLRDGVYRARAWGGPLRCLAPALHDAATTRFNDGKADPAGRFWGGTQYEPRDARKAALYSLEAAGAPALRQRLGDAITANGLAFDRPARRMYWADTPGHVVRHWDWDERTGDLGSPSLFHAFAAKPPGWRADDPQSAPYGGRPDGAALDVEGNYWCAMYEGARVLQIAPSGQVLRELPVPVRCPTMPCFGGPDLRTLYVTSARQGRPASELAQQPLAGHVLWTRVDVPGRPVDFFGG